MNWLKDFVRPKLKELVGGGKDIPENLWHQCPSCQQMIFHRDLEGNLNVCQHCGHHMRIGVGKRLELLFDGGDYKTVQFAAPLQDPLKFKDLKKYSERLKESQAKTAEEDAMIVAHGKMGGQNVVVAAFNFAFMGGSMGTAVGEGIVTASRLAQVQDASLIIIPASGGARMQEGILSLMQMARTTIAVEEVKDKGLPYLVLLTDPTTGGVSASFAMLGDVAIAEPGCIIGFAGRRVIEQTIREQLPEDFQKAEYLLDHGMVDMVVERGELRSTIIRVLSLLRNTGAPGDVVDFVAEPVPMPDGEKKPPVIDAPIPHGARPPEAD
ncbi:acetyl-CoA carboxylase, carboxyltransferase subunit beta [Magnetovibrio sp. PR-2]|uniref:acetyl-CoA carboxylase, carboxyltransferase subunit beta n=1 Tax=Magnetovibrio sp. PR-2 TaxID=3120356 RepID=UPI002FCDF801